MFGAEAIIGLRVDRNGWKFFKPEEINAIVSAAKGEVGDVLIFAADKFDVVHNVLGSLRVELGNKLGLIDKNKFH